MMILLYTIFTLGTLYAAFATLYLFVIALAALFFKPLRVTPPDPLKIMVLVYARDRAPRLDASLAALQGVNYPRERLALLVLADNCADEIEEVARRAGVTVCKCDDPAATGKGRALNWFLKTQPARYAGWHVLAIVDADSRVDPEFCAEVAASLSHASVHVVQGLNGEERLPGLGGWLRALGGAMYKHVRPAGRNQLGGTCGLNGNAMAFRTTILQKYGWPAEPLEFGIRMMEDGLIVHYNPAACVWRAPAAARDRWDSARAAMLTQYGSSIFEQYLQRRSMAYLDQWFDLIVPPVSMVALLNMIMMIFALFLPRADIQGMVYVFAFALALLVFHAVVALRSDAFKPVALTGRSGGSADDLPAADEPPTAPTR